MIPELAGGSIAAAVAAYYERAFADHGAAHGGVDWSTADSQELRFRTLLGGVDWAGRPSLLDFGCGYGALAEHLDLVAPMIEAAGRANAGRPDRRFTTDEAGVEPVDLVVASGAFNVKLDTPAPVWEAYVWQTLGRLGRLAGRRLAFNMLPPASAAALARPHLHYADPDAVARGCEVRLGGRASVRRDYGLWEFTVIVDFAGGGRPAV